MLNSHKSYEVDIYLQGAKFINYAMNYVIKTRPNRPKYLIYK